MISNSVASDESFAKLFGVASIHSATEISARFPYGLTEVGKLLGGKGWHKAQKIIDVIKGKTGIDIKSSDNNHHCKLKIGKTEFGKYSKDAVALLKLVDTGQPYEHLI